jgi:integrase
MDKTHLRHLDRFLRRKYLNEITTADVELIIDSRLAEGVKNATVNRTLEVLRAILRRCVHEWQWLNRAPHVRMLKEPKRRVRYLTHEEARRLLAELPEHLADMAAYTLETGARRANVTGLQWSQVDLERRHAWVHADQAKAKEAIAVPLRHAAVAILRRWLGRHSTHVFCYRGKPIKQVSTKAWYAACKRAAIESFRWHDLRHTWASWHRQQGTPLHVLQELGGWQTFEMVQRYAHLSADHLAPYADRLRGVGDADVP